MTMKVHVPVYPTCTPIYCRETPNTSPSAYWPYLQQSGVPRNSKWFDMLYAVVCQLPEHRKNTGEREKEVQIQ